MDWKLRPFRAFSGGVGHRQQEGVRANALGKEKSDNQQASDLKPGPRVSVVVVGWFGAQERHVQKYSSLWSEQLGIKDVTQVCPSVQSVLFPPTGERDAKKYLQNATAKEDIVIYHVLSLGGFSFFGSLLMQNLETLDTQYNPRNVVGIVFDSGPPMCLSAKNALSGITTGLFVSDEGIPEVLFGNALVRNLWLSVWHTYKVVVGYTQWYEDIVDAFSKHGPRHQLYLYTAQDKILDSSSIELFIQEQERLGKAVSKKKWEKGKHVQLFREYKEEYTAELAGFLKQIV